ncbi:ANR family transcriptional regulator [Gallibacterium anatis]|uniref:ANR family transcriptional regulator n=1 Tax=Gallibacterium anatis TaxID=750 RepID=UPI00254D3728|nr:ANR family transcriptional regulator [Gallibacterium anatis]WIM82544.1 ANR family transcriptional regulator [Gallibacterium anatis]
MSRRPRVERSMLEEAYHEAAETAAEVERSGNYARATQLWADAEKLALTFTQREWCYTRKSYCKKWQGRREKTQ